MKILTTLLCSAALILCGCSITTHTFTDRDNGADFSSYRSFSWIDKHPMIIGNPVPALTNPLMEARIQNAIMEELTAQGFEFVPTGGEADLVVSFTVGARQEIDVDSYPTAYRSWRWGSTYIGDSVEVQTTTEGMLAIDFFDAETKSPVWHGRVEKSLSKKDRKNEADLISRAVAAILADFPSPTPASDS